LIRVYKFHNIFYPRKFLAVKYWRVWCQVDWHKL